jgi:hypothetical protein
LTWRPLWQSLQFFPIRLTALPCTILRCLESGPNVRASSLPVALSIALLSAAPASSAPAAIDPCTLLTPAEISALVGRQMEAGKSFDNGVTRDGARSTTCLWAAPLAPGAELEPGQRLGGRGFVVLNVMNWPGGPSDARKFLNSFNEAFKTKDITSKPVAVNVGADDALWWGDGVAGRKAGVSFGISVAQMGDKATREPRAESLARLLVKRLPGHPA